jgi:hypothetical protein
MVKSDIIEELTSHYDNIDRLKIKDLISFNYIYDNSEKKTGIILEIEKDYNFYKILHVLVDDRIEALPASIVSFELVDV